HQVAGNKKRLLTDKKHVNFRVTLIFKDWSEEHAGLDYAAAQHYHNFSTSVKYQKFAGSF
ncbi:hypothetical protein, partial [Liquorilactobacillus nagelii]|uniref:hypothetical protein n=1 Tax=Liquorilactobacillus nagelii TaxID=82688 RepID=UPI0039EA1774